MENRDTIFSMILLIYLDINNYLFIRTLTNFYLTYCCLFQCQERSCMNNELFTYINNYGDITDDDITEDISETDYDSTTTDDDSTTTSTDDDDDDNRYIILDLDHFTVTREDNYITLEYDESNKKVRN